MRAWTASVAVVAAAALAIAVVGGDAGDGEGAGASAPGETLEEPAEPEQPDDAEQPDDDGETEVAGEAHDAEEVAAALDGVIVALDPGHNTGDREAPDEIAEPVELAGESRPCNTEGGTAPDGTTEPAITLAIAEQLTERLEELGAQVERTREDDDGVGPCIDERATFGAEVGADLLLSLHADDGPPEGQGFIVLHALEANSEASAEVVDATVELANAVRDAFLGAGIPPVDYAGQDGVLGRDDLATLNAVTVPGVLVDAGNLQNDDDAGRLTSAAGQAQVVDALVEAVTAFVAAR